MRNKYFAFFRLLLFAEKVYPTSQHKCKPTHAISGSVHTGSVCVCVFSDRATDEMEIFARARNVRSMSFASAHSGTQRLVRSVVSPRFLQHLNMFANTQPDNKFPLALSFEFQLSTISYQHTHTQHSQDTGTMSTSTMNGCISPNAQALPRPHTATHSN